MTFSIDFHNLTSDRVFGLFLVDTKSTMTHEGLVSLTQMLYSRLHYLLTHTCQEGGAGEGMDSERFSEVAYPLVRQCMEEAAEFFGEDAHVTMDLNLDFYQERAMTHLYQCDLQIQMAVMREEGWVTCPLAEGQLEEAMALLA